MFVWFELMGVSAYALAGFNVEELGPLQGALTFAVTNTTGAYMILTGIALLYARTGVLNLAAIGRALNGHPPDSLVVIAFGLILTGLMVKAAIVPFHFWPGGRPRRLPSAGVRPAFGRHGRARRVLHRQGVLDRLRVAASEPSPTPCRSCSLCWVW